MPNLAFRGQCELSTDLQLQQKGQKHIHQALLPEGAKPDGLLWRSVTMCNNLLEFEFYS